ncbi:MAG: TVP38/TMEM64 family protein [Planctomycetales bacterium]|nr:TVP38/TMEM64 family protein [Planctomycetales bacterium]
MSHLQIRVLPWLVLALLMTGVAGSWLSDGIVFQLIRSDITGPERVACLQQFFHEAGNWAPAAYVLCVTIEVIVAPIPGVLLYAPGGLIFGPLAGGLLALIGNMLGAGISCGLTRSLGLGWLQRMGSTNSSERLQLALERRGPRMIVILRLNPLTSTDLVSYAAGFTRIPIRYVMLSTGIGMAPLCFAQAWLSDSIFNTWPQLLWPLLILSAVYLIVVTIIMARLLRRKPTDAAVLGE